MIALALTLALQTGTPGWPVGVEREVDEGVYMQVVGAEEGWRVWRTETRDRVWCRAVKAARGHRPPEPVGVLAILSSEAPSLEVTWSPEAGFGYGWVGTYIVRLQAKYRPLGARFWTDGVNGDFSPADLGEQPVEVVVESWEYPEIFVGRVEDAGVLDLAGLRWAQDAVRQCTEAAPPQASAGTSPARAKRTGSVQ